jgi:2,3-bisphosphoglycerate-independent phosphoglycerate mutase
VQSTKFISGDPLKPATNKFEGTREHEGDPVPIAIQSPNVRTDDVKKLNERACAKGGLCRIRGKDLMPTIMNLIGKIKKFGA